MKQATRQKCDNQTCTKLANTHKNTIQVNAPAPEQSTECYIMQSNIDENALSSQGRIITGVKAAEKLELK